MPATSTRDIGLLIRDMIEDREMDQFDLDGDKCGDDHIDFVDVSDANNLRVLTESGATFVVRIIKELRQ